MLVSFLTRLIFHTVLVAGGSCSQLTCAKDESRKLRSETHPRYPWLDFRLLTASVRL